ncbi:MAG TPA: inositol monophosphatase family protein [Candidatus Krumholzibacteria bacterium]|nr:inositol monophosphatase family protein [Candidatus Krumholzibacteria bacterium]HRX50411.1 inositol monophosphatase family protein [Candidatus Krumholzibacteria bacterium]
MPSPVPSHELVEQLAAVREVALGAGRLQTEGRQAMGAIDYKGATDMVTDVDRRVEAYLLRELTRLFPDDGVRGEEGTAQPGRSGRTWIVDPLDGTTNYVHGHPFHCVSIACADVDGPLLGAVHAPALDEMFLAVRDGGARLERPRDGEARDLRLGDGPPLQRALLATGFSYLRDDVCALNCDAMKAFLLAGCHGVRRAGSAALDLCHVGLGRLDGYWELRLNPWDCAAGGLVAREAGALVTDLHGGDDWLEWGWLLAAAPALHAPMLQVIREVLGDAL